MTAAVGNEFRNGDALDYCFIFYFLFYKKTVFKKKTFE